MQSIRVEPLTSAAFAPFGDVLTAPTEPGRSFFDARLSNGRPQAHASLSLARVLPGEGLPLVARRMERHQFSSQSFVPTGAARFLIVVAPQGPDGRPATTAARAFVAEKGQGITYGADVWHHPMTVLDAPASFAIVMWCDGSSDDTEFVDVDPFRIEAA